MRRMARAYASMVLGCAFELEVLEMRLVLPLKVIVGGGLHTGLSSRNIAELTPRH